MKKKLIISIIYLIIIMLISILIYSLIRNNINLGKKEINYISFANLSQEDVKKYANTDVKNITQIEEIVRKLKNGKNLYTINIGKGNSYDNELEISYFGIEDELAQEVDINNEPEFIDQNLVVIFALVPDLDYIQISYRKDGSEYISSTGYLRYVFESTYKKDDLSFYLTSPSFFEREVIEGKNANYIPDRIIYKKKEKDEFYIFTKEDIFYDELLEKVFERMEFTAINEPYETFETRDLDTIRYSGKNFILLDYNSYGESDFNKKPMCFEVWDNNEFKDYMDEKSKNRPKYGLENTSDIDVNLQLEKIDVGNLQDKYNGLIYQIKLKEKDDLKNFETRYNIDLNVDCKTGTDIIVTLSKYKLESMNWNLHGIEYNFSSFTDKYNVYVNVFDRAINTENVKCNVKTRHYVKGIITKIDNDVMHVEAGLEYIDDLYNTVTYREVDVVINQNTKIFNIANRNANGDYEEMSFLYLKEGDQVTVESDKIESGNTIVADQVSVVQKSKLEELENNMAGKTILNGGIIDVDVDENGAGTIVFETGLDDDISEAVKINVKESTIVYYLDDKKLENGKESYYGIVTIELEEPINNIKNDALNAKVIDIYDG